MDTVFLGWTALPGFERIPVVPGCFGVPLKALWEGLLTRKAALLLLIFNGAWRGLDALERIILMHEDGCGGWCSGVV